jgi:hypothetical protein
VSVVDLLGPASLALRETSTAGHPARPDPVPWFDRRDRSFVPTWLIRRPQWRAGATIAEGEPAWPMTLKSAALKNGGDGAELSDQQPVVGPETPVRIRRSCRKHSAVTRTQTRLLTIGIPHPAASIVDLSARHPFELPIGSDNEDLVCGACGMVALAGWSVWSTAERLVVDSQMLIRCGRCRTYNVVPTARLAEEPREALAMVHNRLRGLYIRGKSISCR